MTDDVQLRDVSEADLPVLFEHGSDPEAAHMAAFTAKDPGDRKAFTAHWSRILADPRVVTRTITRGEEVVGSISSYEESGRREVTYWIGRSHWGRGIATRALELFLADVDPRRPMRARAAKDNVASRRVLEKCGFTVVGEAVGFANARGAEIEELVLELGEDWPGKT
jgi:RimJ/RimL family protein N-acetyltransferase